MIDDGFLFTLKKIKSQRLFRTLMIHMFSKHWRREFMEGLRRVRFYMCVCTYVSRGSHTQILGCYTNPTYFMIITSESKLFAKTKACFYSKQKTATYFEVIALCNFQHDSLLQPASRASAHLSDIRTLVGHKDTFVGHKDILLCFTNDSKISSVGSKGSPISTKMFRNLTHKVHIKHGKLHQDWFSSS